MSAREAYDALLERWAELSDLSSASALLAWDQETMMPAGAAEGRGPQLATLASLHHQRITADEVGDWLGRCEGGDFDEEEQATLREWRVEFDRATRLPNRLVRETAQAESEGLEAWRQAREADDFPRFAPHLTRLLDLAGQKADALGDGGPRYDALLDLFERGATEAGIAQLFDRLRAELAPMVAAVLETDRDGRDACLRQELDLEAQALFGDKVAAAMGFDFTQGRIDLSAHPFCTGIGPGDTRLTRRFEAGDLRPGLYGIVHEAGHGLYEQGLPAKWSRHPLGGAVSLGVHESQSRLWENVVGRSRPFCEHFLPELRSSFPGRFDDVDVDTLYRAVNHVEASLIRVEADELTYNLHVILRFEVERRLFSGQLAVADLPEFWNTTLHELLGIRPPDEARGCLQDVHWAMGAFGYFPTYTLGTLYASQLDEAARRDLPDLDDQIRRGELAPLREWLREKVHAQGRRYEPQELLQRATGEAPSEAAFLRAMRAKLSELFGIS